MLPLVPLFYVTVDRQEKQPQSSKNIRKINVKNNQKTNPYKTEKIINF